MFRLVLTGDDKGMHILLNEEDKMSIEKAAEEGVSMSRFIVERALNAAKRASLRSLAGKAPPEAHR